jgi:nucleoside-diphosphate-sugar epimerase
MRVLITGAAGFLGSHLCDRFLADGHEVIGMDNLITGNTDNIAHLLSEERFRFIKHDVTNYIYIEGRLDGVLHFASPASPVDYLELPIPTLKVGSLGTHTTLGLAKAKGARYLLASTSEVYGDPQVHPQPESYWGNVNPVGPRGVYDEAKRFAEAMTMAYHRAHGVETRIVRIFNTYGPRMRMRDGRVVPNFITQALKGEPLTVYGQGEQTRSFQYVDDLVSGIQKLLESGENLPVNIGNPYEMTVLEFAKKIIELTGSRSSVVYKPLPQDDPQHVTALGAERPGAATGAAGEIAERRGALVDQVVFSQAPDAGKAVGEIEAGTYHVYAQGISSPTIYQRVRDSQRIGHELSYGRNTEITINPSGPEFATGEINPFHVPEIREALNWLVDRRYIAEELYGGLAVPRYLPLTTTFPDYTRLAAQARALEQRYRHDPDRAERVIAREMEALGAVFEGGLWRYDGRPVRISILIRTDDERVRIGDYLANLLDGLGFQVERMYRTAEEATRIWIAGDPAAGRWHLYTGGWVAIVINRDQGDNFSYYYTPRGRPDPLWQAYTPDPEFDELADRLARRDYASFDERQEMMADALEMSMKDSVRIWLVDQLSITPRAVDVELAADLAGGISGSRLWPYTIRLRDQVGGNLVFAVPTLLTEPWNPVAGSNWIFDQMIIRGLDDPPLLPDPFT